MMLILCFSTIATFERSDDELYTYTFYDTANRNYIPGNRFSEFTSDDPISEVCNVPGYSLTAQPKIIEQDSTRFTILQGEEGSTPDITFLSSACVVVADMEAVISEPIAEVGVYDNGSEHLILIPYPDLTVHSFYFNGSTVTADTIYNLTYNVTGSRVTCAEMDHDGDLHCLYQSTANNIADINIDDGTVTEHAVMGGSVVDTNQKRKPALAYLIDDNELVAITGKATADTMKLCVYDFDNLSLYSLFNGGSCLTYSDVSGNSFISIDTTAPMLYNLDGGSSNEIIIAFQEEYMDGGSDDKWYFKHHVYSASGTLKTSKTDLVCDPGYHTSMVGSIVVSPLFITIADAGTYSLPYACSFMHYTGTNCGEETQISCIYTSTNKTYDDVSSTFNDPVTNVISGDFASSFSGKELVVDGGYFRFNPHTGIFSTISAGFTNDGYFSFGDMDDDGYLDMIFDDGVNTVYGSTQELNDAPRWTDTDELFQIIAESSLLCNDTSYGVVSSTDYIDDNLDQVRMVVDCQGDGSNIVYSDYDSGGSPAPLVAECDFNETGTFVMRVWIEDDRGLVSGNATVSYTVTDDDTVCAANIYGPIYGGTVGSTTADTPEEDYEDVLGEFGLTGSWLTVAWIIVMLFVAFAVISACAKVGMGGTSMVSALALVEILMLVLGWVFGAIGSVVLVMVGVVAAAIMTIIIMGRGE